MPGIFGVIGSRDASERKAMVRRMQKSMLHEAFYSSGIHENDSLDLSVGWVAHEGAFADCTPVWNESKTVCLIFSGDDFRDSSEVGALRSSTHRCESSPAAYLVQLYERSGLGFLEELNGWFSGVVIDLREGKSVLFNDRYGLQRIHYHQHAAGFVFASEAKAILSAMPSLRKVDFTSLGEAFSLGCVLQNRTLFPEIALLPGASSWTFHRGGRLQRGTYFNVRQWEGLPRLDGPQYYARLREIFPRILPRYLSGPQRVAMSLTGGLDGRMIMAWAKLAPGSMPCYSFGGMFRECLDVRIARQIAALLQQPHSTIVVGAEFFPRFPSLAEKAVYLSDGLMDVSGAVELYVNRIAREIAPVRLTGNYGSEVIRGNVAFRPGAFPQDVLAPEFFDLVKLATTTYAQERDQRDISFIAFKQVPWHHYSRLSLEQSQLSVRSPYLDNELVALMHQAPEEAVTTPAASLRLVAEGDRRLANIETDRGIRYGPVTWLSSLSHRYREFTAKAEYAYDYGMPQWLSRLDHTFARFHPERLFLGRHKFYHFRVWYRDHFAQYLRDVLLDPRATRRSWVRAPALERMVNSHIAGIANHTAELHRMLTTEIFHRKFIDRDG